MVDINTQFPMDIEGFSTPPKSRLDTTVNASSAQGSTFTVLTDFDKPLVKTDFRLEATDQQADFADRPLPKKELVLFSDDDNTGRIKFEVVNNQVVLIVANGLGIEEDRLPHMYVNNAATEAYQGITDMLEKEQMTTFAQ